MPRKGHSGRKKKFDDEYHRVANKLASEYYNKHKKERNKAMRDYHVKNLPVLKYAKEHGISIPEARKQLEKEKEVESSEA
jgi:hypothetical protein